MQPNNLIPQGEERKHLCTVAMSIHPHRVNPLPPPFHRVLFYRVFYFSLLCSVLLP